MERIERQRTVGEYRTDLSSRNGTGGNGQIKNTRKVYRFRRLVISSVDFFQEAPPLFYKQCMRGVGVFTGQERLMCCGVRLRVDSGGKFGGGQNCE